jgi:hypothetical protein
LHWYPKPHSNEHDDDADDADRAEDAGEDVREQPGVFNELRHEGIKAKELLPAVGEKLLHRTPEFRGGCSPPRIYTTYTNTAANTIHSIIATPAPRDA